MSYFNNDWPVNHIWQATIYDGRQNGGFDLWHISLPEYTLGEWQYDEANEIKQLDRFFSPVWNSDGTIDGFYLSFTALLIEVDMDDGKFMDCSIWAIYNIEITTLPVWNGEKQEHQDISCLSYCNITADFNGVYANGVGGVFDNIMLFNEDEGLWELEKIWELFKEEVLIQNEQPSGFNQQKLIVF